MEEVFAREPLSSYRRAVQRAADDEMNAAAASGMRCAIFCFVGEKKLKQLFEEALSARCRTHGSPVALQQTRSARERRLTGDGMAPGASSKRAMGKTLDEAQRHSA